MTEEFADNTANLATRQPQIERMPLPSPLYDWSASGAHLVEGSTYGSVLPTLYADDSGPLNPYGPREERGDEGSLRYDGPTRTNDLTMLRQTEVQDAAGNPITKWQAFVVQRLRTGEFALPGGFQDATDADGLAGGLRELTEETGVTFPFGESEVRRRIQTVFAGPTLSPRATNRRWIETKVNVIILSEAEAATLQVTLQKSEVITAQWIDLDQLAGGQIGDSPVRPSHVPYFAHLQSQLAKTG